jgi:hypothetical protein
MTAGGWRKNLAGDYVLDLDASAPDDQSAA